MKPLITTFAIVAMTLIGLASTAAAHNYNGPAGSSYIYISGYTPHGTPVYTERYLSGYDRWGNPVWSYRIVSAPIRYADGVCPPRRYNYSPAHPSVYQYYRQHGDRFGPLFRR